MDVSTVFLIVDDHQSMRRTIADILRALGYREFLYAEDGKQAWDVINAEHVDLVLLDWNMPVMSGIELLRTIRASDTHDQLPVLMVTAEAFVENVMEAMESGINDYIVKPFMPKTLEEKLKGLAEKTGI